ncbi:MAG TPA: 16S rRNA (uracil(1498)-N(3))-methyltransferase [Firmicutes bacterium]|nr:16S rRNA (uracil(1498)-N(3))-methyltransferase [Bacillota bacterium]
MHRFFARPDQFQNGKVFIDSVEARHIKKVLRLKAGTIIRVFDGLGHEYEVQLAPSEGGTMWGQVMAPVDTIREPKLKVTLAQGLGKGDKNDLVVQKATEIGVQAIIPVACKRSIVKLSTKTTKEERLRRVAKEAAKQCGRAVVPSVEPACSFNDLLRYFPKYDAVLFLWEKERVQDLKHTLQKIRQQSSPTRLLVLVGPEGGFTDTEASQATERGAQAVSLGPRILRTETAGLVALSAILYEFDELTT